MLKKKSVKNKKRKSNLENGNSYLAPLYAGLFFVSSDADFEWYDNVTADSGGIHFFALSSFILALAVALRSSVYGAEMR